jgi:hypothetical protein
VKNPCWSYEPEDFDSQAAWWLPPARLDGAAGEKASPATSSRLFPQAGIARMAAERLDVTVDAGPFGARSGGHSHSDSLSVLARANGKDILIDAGTFTYTGNEAWRNWFRGSAAHNTIRIDTRDQGTSAGPFRWEDPPAVEINQWDTRPDFDFLEAECRYAGCIHRRSVLLVKPALLIVFDEILGVGEHQLEQFWHLGLQAASISPRCFRIGSEVLLTIPSGDSAELYEGGEHGWRSRAYGHKEASPVLRIFRRCSLPARFWTALDFSGAGEAVLEVRGPADALYTSGSRSVKVIVEGREPRVSTCG